MTKLLLLGVSLLFSSHFAHAFPEMVRHDYVNCTSCHVSQNGGGILTPYGRELSRELLSTWGKKGEEQFLYGVVKPPEWLNLGGDVRAVQTYVDNDFIERASFIAMQFDLEAAVTLSEKTQIVATLGKEHLSTANPSFIDYLISRKHYLRYQLDDELSFRIGRFQFAYGINLPEHVLQIKSGLLWDQGTETYNLEASYMGDEWDLFVTANLGRFEESSLDLERGFALRASQIFFDSNKVGLSYFYGTNNTQNRHVFGPWAILGITESFYILTELDFQKLNPKIGSSGDTFGAAFLFRPAYEIIQGLHLFLTADVSRLNFNNQATMKENYGPGVQFFPRPHFNFQLIYYRTRNQGVSQNFGDAASLMGHFYL